MSHRQKSVLPTPTADLASSEANFITFLSVFLLSGELSILFVDLIWILIFWGLFPSGSGILLGS